MTEHISLTSCNEQRDKVEVIQWITQQYGFDPAEVSLWVTHLHFNWPLSVKATDPQGSTVGYLNMSDYRIEEETEYIVEQAPRLLQRLNAYRYTAVFSFIVAPPYRGTDLNYRMIQHIMPQLRQYDFIFIPVMHHLHTHQYWKRWGALEFFRDPNCVYYLLPFNPDVKALLVSEP